LIFNPGYTLGGTPNMPNSDLRLEEHDARAHGGEVLEEVRERDGGAVDFGEEVPCCVPIC
jgi:hypothetical protein